MGTEKCRETRWRTSRRFEFRGTPYHTSNLSETGSGAILRVSAVSLCRGKSYSSRSEGGVLIQATNSRRCHYPNKWDLSSSVIIGDDMFSTQLVIFLKKTAEAAGANKEQPPHPTELETELSLESLQSEGWALAGQQTAFFTIAQAWR